jgi:hypothetical protein
MGPRDGTGDAQEKVCPAVTEAVGSRAPQRPQTPLGGAASDRGGRGIDKWRAAAA